ncbi:MAG: PAS domain S-box protein, partial [Candidatus Goldiibacteriota bacterium]
MGLNHGKSKNKKTPAAYTVEILSLKRRLKESEEKYSLTLDTASSAIASVDIKGRITEYNRAAAALLGVNRNELIGKTFKKIMKPDSFKTAFKRLGDVMKRGYSYGGEYKMIRKNGAIIDVVINSTAFRATSGEFIKTISVLEDVTARKNSEKLLKEQSVFKELRAQIWKLAAEKTISEASLIQGLVDRLGPALGCSRVVFSSIKEKEVEVLYEWKSLKTRGSVRGIKTPWPLFNAMKLERQVVLDEKSIYLTVPASMRGILKIIVSGLMKRFGSHAALSTPCYVDGIREGVIICVGDGEMIKKWSGERKTIVLEAARIASEGISHRRAAMSAETDILYRKKAEEKLRFENEARLSAEQKIEESEKFYRELFNNNNDAIVVMELILENQPFPFVSLIDFNEMACRIFDTPREELVKKKVSEFIKQPWLDKIRAEVAALKTGDTSTGTIEITRSAGKIITCELRIKVFAVGGKQLIFCVLRDITERLESESAIKESEELYRTLINILPDGVIMSDLEGRIIFASDRTSLMHGYDGSMKLAGKHILDLVDNDSKSGFIRDFRDFQGGEGTAMTEYTALRRDRTRFTGEIYSSVLKDLQGRPKAVISAIRDITERRKIEEALKENEKKYRTVISQTGQLVYEYILSSGVIIWGGAIREITGHTVEEFNREVSIDIWEEMIHPEDRPREVELLESARKQCGKYKSEYRFRTKSNGYIYMEDEGMFLADERGEAYKMIGVMKDISERKKYETELKESGDKFKSLSEQSLLGIAILQDGRVKYSNDAFAGIYGYSKESIESWSYDDFYSRVENEDALMLKNGSRDRKKIPGDQQKNYQFRMKSGDGKIKWIDVYVRSILYEGRQADFITQADISNLKDTEEKLRSTINELERSNAELEQFAYVASHDLQEPLRVISSYVQLLKKRYEGKLGSDADDFIAFTVEGAGRMQQLIRDLLAYSRLGTHKKEYTLVAMDDVISTVMKNMETVIAETNASVSFSGLPSIMADMTQLVQLAQNLISNSVKFAKKGEAPEIIITAERKPGGWTFKFSDHGIGIDSQYYEKIFVIFQRLHGKGEYPGTGIGLAICKKIVESFGGSIWLESKEGEGADFYF